MKKWGIVVTLAYGVVVLAGILPVGLWGWLSTAPDTAFITLLKDVVVWLWLAALVGCEALLLFLRVDTSARRPERRRHVAVSATAAGCAIAILTYAALQAVALAGWGESATISELLTDSAAGIFGGVAILWILWSVIFFRRLTHAEAPLDRALRWLMKGSVLELLIVVPCHIIVRRRGDCSAPAVTGFGIATGLAVMLMAFGPSILFLIEERRRHYRSSLRPVQP